MDPGPAARRGARRRPRGVADRRRPGHSCDTGRRPPTLAAHRSVGHAPGDQRLPAAAGGVAIPADCRSRRVTRRSPDSRTEWADRALDRQPLPSRPRSRRRTRRSPTWPRPRSNGSSWSGTDGERAARRSRAAAHDRTLGHRGAASPPRNGGRGRDRGDVVRARSGGSRGVRPRLPLRPFTSLGSTPTCSQHRSGSLTSAPCPS